MSEAPQDFKGLTPEEKRARLKRLLAEIDPDAVVRVRLVGVPEGEAREALRAAAVRDLAPATMTLTVQWPRSAGRGRSRK